MGLSCPRKAALLRLSYLLMLQCLRDGPVNTSREKVESSESGEFWCWRAGARLFVHAFWKVQVRTSLDATPAIPLFVPRLLPCALQSATGRGGGITGTTKTPRPTRLWTYFTNGELLATPTGDSPRNKVAEQQFKTVPTVPAPPSRASALRGIAK